MHMQTMVLGLLSITVMSEAANILCFAPTTMVSHQLLARTMMKKLAERGHNVTLFTTDPFESDLPNLVQHSWNYTYDLYGSTMKMNIVRFREENTNIFTISRYFINAATAAMKLQLQHPAIGELINSNRTFDLVVVEAFAFTPFYAFSRHFNAPLVGFTTLDSPIYSHIAVGDHIHPIIHPDPLQLGLDELSFLQRLITFVTEGLIVLNYLSCNFEFDPLIRQYFGPDMANTMELANSLDFLIYSNHPVFDSIRPSSPASLPVGFMHIEETKPLNGDLAEYFQQTEQEVIYFSLGSNVRSSDLSKQTVETFLEVFKRLNYNILWKWDGLELEDKPGNVKLVRWVPQQDVLAQTKVRLFITQGGQQSMEEAIYHSVPMLAIPFYADQFLNAYRIEKLGVGLHVDIRTLTADILESTINRLMSNESFRMNAQKHSNLAKDQPMTSLESSVWWLEYVIRHRGAKHLHSSIKSISFWEIFMLDIWLVLIIFGCIAYKVLEKVVVVLIRNTRSELKVLNTYDLKHQKVS